MRVARIRGVHIGGVLLHARRAVRRVISVTKKDGAAKSVNEQEKEGRGGF